MRGKSAFSFLELVSMVFLAGSGSGSYSAPLEGTYDHWGRLFRWANTLNLFR
jgi:hypothetical protein